MFSCMLQKLLQHLFVHRWAATSHCALLMLPILPHMGIQVANPSTPALAGGWPQSFDHGLYWTDGPVRALIGTAVLVCDM